MGHEGNVLPVHSFVTHEDVVAFVFGRGLDEFGQVVPQFALAARIAINCLLFKIVLH